MKKIETLVKKVQSEKIKRIKTAIMIEKQIKKNIKNIAEKKQNLKCKATLVSISGLSEK